jgi:AcrR family transcriptional regulator
VVSIFQKRVRKSSRRRRGPDGKFHGIIDAGIRLLARKDYEAISMARIAREAGCSVGALYARFPEKNSYLYHLIASAYRTMAHRAETELEAQPSGHMPLPSLVRHVVGHIVGTMTDARAAGVIRATIKLSTVKPITIELFEDYRKEVTRSAVAVLSPRIRGNSTGAIRLGMQIVLATVTDAILQPHPGPMAAGTKRMKDALAQVMLGYLGGSKSGSWAGEEADGEDETETALEPDEPEKDDTPTDANAVYDPELRTFHKPTGMAKQPSVSKVKNSKITKAGHVSRNTSPASLSAPTIVKPPAVPKGSPEPTKPKRKHRWI